MVQPDGGFDGRLSCGDGYVDDLAGEECDSNLRSSYANACADEGMGMGEGACDPETCQLVVTPEQCAVCGDGIVTAPVEQCDPNAEVTRQCPSGKGSVSCTDSCRFDFTLCDGCGDGIFDEQVESCEPIITCDGPQDCPMGQECSDAGTCRVDPNTFVPELPCTNQTGPFGLFSDGTINPVTDCRRNCEFATDSCSYCGNGQLDGAYFDFDALDSQVSKPAELCDPGLDPDDPAVDAQAQTEYCQDLCTDGGGSVLQLRCKVLCEEDCQDFKDVEWEDPEQRECCIRSGEPCSAEFPCCFELDHPDLDPEEYDVCVLANGAIPVCRSTLPPEPP